MVIEMHNGIEILDALQEVVLNDNKDIVVDEADKEL